jgi:hypothetical protein
MTAEEYFVTKALQRGAYRYQVALEFLKENHNSISPQFPAIYREVRRPWF